MSEEINCYTCLYEDGASICGNCGDYYNKWKPKDHHPDTGKEIEEAERKAFEAARELHPTKFAERKYETFKAWKEAGE